MAIIDFGTWFEELMKLAKEKDLEWIISDPDDYLESFMDGNSPEEELSEAIDSVR